MSVVGEPEWIPIVGLAALGISGRAWGLLAELGGAAKVWGTDALLLEVFHTYKYRQGFLRQLDSKEDSPAHLRTRASLSFQSVGLFMKRGGYVLGTKGLLELGRLSSAPNPPLCAFAKGNIQHLHNKPQIALVGSRGANEKGLLQAFEIAKATAHAGCSLVSGGALGIDTAAHKGAIAGNGVTVAILGNPVSKAGALCPPRLLKLAESEYFLALTVYGPWMNTVPALFVSRNQYVAALADAVVVAQGKSDSGALYTAKYAQSMNIPLWALPGDLEDEFYAAPNNLLEQGSARALVKTETLLKTLVQTEKTSDTGKSLVDDTPRPQEVNLHPILQALRKLGGRASLDDLCETLHVSFSGLQTQALELELEGKLRKQGGQLMLASG